MDVRKITIIGVFVCSVLLVLAIAVGRYSGSLFGLGSGENAWNAQLIRSSLAGVQVREVDSSHAAVVFLYDLDNRSGSDYHLASGSNVVIMNRLKGGALASNDQASLESDAFVPSGNKARIALDVTQPFDWPSQQNAAAQKSFQDLVTKQVSDVRAFVLFDQADRYQIELPAQFSVLEHSATSADAN